MATGSNSHTKTASKNIYSLMTPLVIAFTPNYFVPAATMLQSVLASSEGTFRVICLVSEEIPARMQEKLQRLGRDRMSFEYIALGGRLKDIYTDPRYSEAASYRLLLPDLLPDYDKVVYVDCDVIVRQDLDALYRSTSLEGCYLAAVFEAPIEKQAERFAALGCRPREYFNSGFLVMNLAAMRQEGVVERLLEASKVDYLEFPDQDALNQVCMGRVRALSPLYNGIRTFFIPRYKPDFVAQYGSEALWQEVQEKATIHYTGGKPWNLFTVKFSEWWSTYDKLPREIQCEWTPSRKITILWHVYRTTLGRKVIDATRAVVRKLKG